MGDDVNVEDMAEMLRSMPKYQQLIKKYEVHLNLANGVAQVSIARGIQNLIVLEQNIISGLDHKG